MPVGVEMHAAVDGELAQEAQVLAAAGPSQHAECALGRRRYDHVHAPHLAAFSQVVPKDMVKPAPREKPVRN